MGRFAARSFWFSATLLALNELVNLRPTPNFDSFANLVVPPGYASAVDGLQALLSLACVFWMVASAGLVAFLNRRRAAPSSWWVPGAPLAFACWVVASFLLNGGNSSKPSDFYVLVIVPVLMSAATAVARFDEEGCPERHVVRMAWTGAAAACFAMLFPYEVYGRIFGTTSNPNQLAGYLAFAAFLLAGAALASQSGRRRIALSAGAILVLIALWWTGSRGGLMGLACGGALVLSARLFARGRAALGACAALAVAGAFGAVAWAYSVEHGSFFHGKIGVYAGERLSGWQVGNTAYRRAFSLYYDFNEDGRLDSTDLVLAASMAEGWQSGVDARSSARPSGSALRRLWFKWDKKLRDIEGEEVLRLLGVLCGAEIFLNRPLAGAGPGNWGPALEAVDPGDSWRLSKSHSHCLPSHLAAELGLVGLLGWASLGVCPMALAWRGGGAGRALSPGVLALLCAGLMAAFVHNLFDVTLLFRPLRFVFPVVAGAVFGGFSRPDSGGGPC